MRVKLHVTFAAIAVVLFLSSAHAELIWDTTDLGLRPVPGAEQVEVDFAYSNSGKVPVAITEVTPSCGCVKAEATAKIIEPGQSGKIHAVFKTASASGHVSKSIRVFTDEIGVAPVTLHLNIDLTPAYVVSPRRLHWKLHETPASKYIEVTVATGTNLGDPIVKTSPVGFEFSLASVPNQRGHFRLAVTPRTTDVAQRVVAALEFTGAGSADKKAQVLIAVE